jgi:hypothetical protein
VVFLGGRPSHRLRLRRCAPVPPPAVATFDAVVGKWRAGSISTLEAAETAVSAGIVVVGILLVGPVIVVAREGQRSGVVRVGEPEVVEKGKRRTLGFSSFLSPLTITTPLRRPSLATTTTGPTRRIQTTTIPAQTAVSAASSVEIEPARRFPTMASSMATAGGGTGARRRRRRR